MSSNQYRKIAYGLSDPLLDVFPAPIISNRAPTTDDLAQLGSMWILKSSNLIYILTSIVGNSANWVALATGGNSSKFPFLAMQIAGMDVANATGDNTDYELGSLAALTTVFDVGNNVFVGDGVGAPATFTAPVTGVYSLTIAVLSQFDNNVAQITAGQYEIATTSLTYIGCLVSPEGVGRNGNDNSSSVMNLSFSVVAHMNVGHTATFAIRQNLPLNPQKIVQITGSNNAQTAISGFLIE